jgi:lysophospholipase L1-like esterase
MRSPLLALFVVVFGAACADEHPTSDASVTDSGATADAPVDGGPVVTDSGPGTDSGVDRTHVRFVPSGLLPETATRLIVLGDSISAGVGASSSARVYGALLAENDDGAYPSESATDLESLTGGAVEVLDYSAGGATTRDLVRQTNAVERNLTFPASGHTVVVLTIGGNDLQGSIFGGDPTGEPLDAAILAIRRMVTFFQDPTHFADGVSVYLADVYDPSDGVAHIDGCFLGLTLPELVDALFVWRDRYIELGTEMGFAVIDMLGHFHGHAYYYDDPTNPYYDAADPSFWFADCIHPNDRGHHEIRRLFYEAMDPSYVVAD